MNLIAKFVKKKFLQIIYTDSFYNFYGFHFHERIAFYDSFVTALILFKILPKFNKI